MSMVIDDPKDGQVDISLDMSSENNVSHSDRFGQAMNILNHTTNEKFASTRRGSPVLKLFWAEELESSTSPLEILLRAVNEVAEREPDVRNHVPEILFHHKFPDCSAPGICKGLDLPKEARTFYMIMFRELTPITTLTGDSFLTSWWDAVKCHLVLWKNGVQHLSVSAPNLMYKVDGNNVVGVLNNIDLPTLVPKGVTENERTGAVPFMAMELLTDKGLEGTLKHVYAHDAESFIWVLTWACLRYANDDGQLCKRGRPLDDWFKVDARGCRGEKLSFLLFPPTNLTAGKGHERNWFVAKRCLIALLLYRTNKVVSPETTTDEPCEGPFEALLKGPYQAAEAL